MYVERLDHAPNGAEQTQQRRYGRNAVEHAEIAPQHVGDALAFIEHGLFDFDGRFAPFANAGGEHAGDVTRFVFAALERFGAIEGTFAHLEQESLDEQVAERHVRDAG